MFIYTTYGIITSLLLSNPEPTIVINDSLLKTQSSLSLATEAGDNIQFD